MTTIVDINVFDQGGTTNASPLNLGQFEFFANMAALVKVQVVAFRSDGATKAWSLESLVKRLGAGPLVQETLPSPINNFGIAADDTALAGVGIAMFTNGTYVGVACTGQAAQNIDWSVTISGRGLRQ